ncbi:acyltransferase domain-containing protein [Nonomuraea antimicrobica]
MIGHSLGEYVAACVAGVMSLPDALALVAARGRLMQALPPGDMLAVACSEEDLAPLLPPGVEPAAVNGPLACVVAGPPEAVEALLADLTGRGVAARRLRTSHAFHSAMMEPVLEEFRALVRSVRLAAPTLPYVSNVTGTWITADEATDPDYWVRHLRQTVRFWPGARLLAQDPSRVYLEVGPGESLSRAFTPQDAVFSTLRHDRPDEAEYLRERIGQAWAAGLQADWGGLVDPDARRIELPTYPFERTRFWVDPAEPAAVTRREPAGFYRVRWDDAPPAPLSGAPATWLVLADEGERRTNCAAACSPPGSAWSWSAPVSVSPRPTAGTRYDRRDAPTTRRCSTPWPRRARTCSGSFTCGTSTRAKASPSVRSAATSA